MIGTKLGKRYELLERVGGGGMALVFKGRDTLLDRTVAVKMLRSQYTADEDVVKRFRREAQAAASLSHANVVNIYDVGQEDDMYYIVMEFIAGRTLKKKIQQEGKVEIDRAVDIAIQICEALEHAHAHKVIHRDIKPHNIMLTTGGRVKVADFGIARASTSATLTHSGTIMGSVHYFSPEQARGGFSGERSDLYSLGVVLYEMLTGKVPFEGDSAVTIALKHVQEPVAPPRKLNPEIPETLEKIVLKALEKEQGLRYQSAAEMLRDLRALQDKGRRTAPAEAAASPKGQGSQMAQAVEPAPTGREVKQTSRSPRRNRRRPGSMVVALLVLVAAVAYGWTLVNDWLNVATVQVPNVVGKNLTEAQRVLREAKLAPSVVAERYDEKVQVSLIITQMPEGGQMVKAGRTVNLIVSMGQEFIEVPDITNQTVRAASILLSGSGLDIGAVMSRNHPTVPQDSVITQNPRAGTRVPKGTRVDVEVSMGPEAISVVVPNFVGESVDIVLQKLGGLKLVPGAMAQRESDKPAGTVLEHDPAAGAEVAENSTINFVVSKGKGLSTRQAPIFFMVPGSGPSQVAVRITLTDAYGTRTIYERQHSPGTEVRLQVEWAGPEARVRYFINQSPYKEDLLR
ncbi:MAG: Stk1 family PASTA domain-containing Ser/Thr kinase [Bacillota bacterium]|nr:Stk1 family PASTA domain-containing Ser/Thr kinase [Bacillota bacterium]